jgi:DNA invertase Pin-like site-specific DNA recombinase
LQGALLPNSFIGMHTKPESPLRALLYARVSRARPGVVSRSPQEQLAELRERCARHGWAIGPELTEDGISASRHARKDRAEWRRVLDLVESGQVDIVCVWESSRAVRQLGEFTALRDLLRAKGVLLSTSDGLLDMANSGHRTVAGIKAVLDEEESERTRERVLRGMRHAAAQGRPHGFTPYGFRRVYDPATGALAAQVVDEDQAAVIQECASRLLAGESLSSIANDLNRRGIPTPRTGVWQGITIRQLVMRPSVNGKREHKGALVAGQWPAILDDRTYAQVCALLTDPARKTRREPDTERVHLLSGIIRCGRCGSVCRSLKSPNQPARGNGALRKYCCGTSRRCVVRWEDETDAYVQAVVCEVLAKPNALAAWATDDDTVLAAKAEVQAVEARLKDLRAKAATGALSLDSLAAIEPALIAQLADATARAEVVTLPAVLDGVDPAEIARQWDKTVPIETKRLILRTLFEVTLLPVRRGRREFDPAGVRVKVKEPTSTS